MDAIHAFVNKPLDGDSNATLNRHDKIIFGVGSDCLELRFDCLERKVRQPRT